MRKRQCQTLLTLIGLEMKQSSALPESQESDDEIRDIIANLLELATADDASNRDTKDISETAQRALLHSLRIISVSYFSSTILSMLSQGNKKVSRVNMSSECTYLFSFVATTWCTRVVGISIAKHES